MRTRQGTHRHLYPQVLCSHQVMAVRQGGFGFHERARRALTHQSMHPSMLLSMALVEGRQFTASMHAQLPSASGELPSGQTHVSTHPSLSVSMADVLVYTG